MTALDINIIGAGFGRTGTVSTRAAMEILGYVPNYHCAEAAAGLLWMDSQTVHFMGKIAKFLGIPFCSFPRGKTDLNANKKSKNLMELWLEATLEKQKGNDEKVKEILRVLLNGYRSTLDYPSCIFYKELLELCPDAKVLLTIRDTPEVWAESVTSSIGLLVNYVDCWYHYVPSLFHGLGHRSFSAALKENGCGGDVKNWLNKEWLKLEYEKHVKEVVALVPDEKLIIFNVKEGWKPLCDKLGLDCPDKKFPKLNDSSNIQMGLKTIKIIDTVTWLGLIGGVSITVIYGLKVLK